MSSVQPGRLPAAVYRRRRIVVGLAALAVLAVIVLLISALVQPRPQGSAPPATGGETTKPSPTETSDPSAACDPAVIEVTPVTDASQYPDGVLPLVSMQIVNKGAVACTLDVGTDVQLYEIVSGNDPIWNSRDCQREPAGAQMVVEPNVPLSTTPFTWDRTRSSTSTCDSERPAVSADGATYRLSVTLGSIRSETDAPFMLF